MVTVLGVRKETDSNGARHECLDLISSTLRARLHCISPDGPALSFLGERNGGSMPVNSDVVGEAKDGEDVVCLIVGPPVGRLLMLVLVKAEGEGGKYRRLGTTGANRKAPDRMKFFNPWDMELRALSII